MELDAASQPNGLPPYRMPIGVSACLDRTAQTFASKTATIFEGEERSWGETRERVSRMASALVAAGVRSGDRVAVLALTSHRFFELLIAVPRAGGIIVPLNWRWSLPELESAISDCTPTVLFFDRAMALAGGALAAARPEMTVVALDPDLDGLPFYETLVGTNVAGEEVVRGGDDAYQLAYTGGTTGRSKAAILSHRNVHVHALTVQAEGIMGHDCRYLMNGPLFHAAGMWPCISLTIAGGTAVLMNQFEPHAALQLIERYRTNQTLFVPTPLRMVIDHPKFADFDTSSMRMICHGGSPITRDLLDRAIKAMPQAAFVNIYGMTELSPVCAVRHHAHIKGEDGALHKPDATGRAISGVGIRVVDTQDRELPRGQVGEIVVRGETMMLGYWQRPQETAEAMQGGWMHTGDGGFMDEDGFIHVVDRVKDMIISGGENIYSAEVEDAICSHPAVDEAAVIGIPDEKWGERVHAIIRLHDGQGVTQEEIVAHARALIAGYKVPRSVEFRVEPFPLTPANKVLKRELRKPYWDGRATSVA